MIRSKIHDSRVSLINRYASVREAQF
jgi:hypothetical protein